jgi:hypothetical protein
VSYKVYPVQKTEETFQDYKIKVNGEETALNVARVSAVPYNRRWPGYQRKKRSI